MLQKMLKGVKIYETSFCLYLVSFMMILHQLMVIMPYRIDKNLNIYEHGF